MPAFTRFFDAIRYSHGELTNYANIARDCGIDAKTVRGYYEILVDTLLGRMVEPYKRRQSRQVITKASKFYLFDVGVGSRLTSRGEVVRGTDAYGPAFEHFVFTELVAHASYSELRYHIRFWRTRAGREVDFVLGDGEVAIEVKSTSRVDNRQLRSIKAFGADNDPRLSFVVCDEPVERVVDGIRIIPWRVFLEKLWGGHIVH